MPRDAIGLRAVSAVVSAVLAALPAVAQDVVINEFWTHDSAGTSSEYIELYSATGADLHGLSLLIVNGNTNNPVASGYRRVMLRMDFPAGESIEPGGYYLLGGSGLPAVYEVNRPLSGNIPEAAVTIALVRTQDIQTCSAGNCPHVDENELSEASIQAITANLVDAVAVRDDDPSDPVFFNAPALGPNPNGDCWDAGARMPDGSDADSPGDFSTQDNFTLTLGSAQDLLSTPGRSNDTPGGACCLPGGECRLLAAADCIRRGGTYAGNGSLCANVVCATGTAAPDDCICETDGQEGTSVFDLLEFLDCWFEGCP